jgi:hypothetical protein
MKTELKVGDKIFHKYLSIVYTVKIINNGIVCIQDNHRPEVLWFPEEDFMVLGYEMMNE